VSIGAFENGPIASHISPITIVCVSLISLLLPVIPRFCLVLYGSACYSALLIVYLNVLDFNFKIETTTFYFTSVVELVQQYDMMAATFHGILIENFAKVALIRYVL
jgi:membrane protein implicated in regulation of membrane protease activity